MENTNQETKYVVKISNEIVRNSFKKMDKLQLDILAYILSRYVNKQTDEAEKGMIETSVGELCDLMGLERGGKRDRDIINACHKLSIAQAVWLKPENDEVRSRAINYFSTFDATSKTLKIAFKFNQDILPFIENLTNNFTLYLANDYDKLKTRAGKMLYELCCSFLGLGGFTKTLDDLKKILDAQPDQMKNNRKFMYEVIKKGCDDINSNTKKLHVSYETIKHGRTIVAIEFTIRAPRQGFIDNNTGLWVCAEQQQDLYDYLKMYLSDYQEAGRIKREEPERFNNYKRNYNNEFMIVLRFICEHIARNKMQNFLTEEEEKQYNKDYSNYRMLVEKWENWVD